MYNNYNNNYNSYPNMMPPQPQPQPMYNPNAYQNYPNYYQGQGPNSYSNQTFNSSNHLHPLTYVPRNGYRCNGVCKSQYPPGACSYYCSLCDFDLCPNCFHFIESSSGQPQNNAYVNCHPHPLKFVPRDGFGCNLCQQMFPKGDCSYYCSMCDYDVCQFCFNRARCY